MRLMIENLGRSGIELCVRLGVSGFFFFRVIFVKPRWRQAFRLLWQQLYHVGVLSLPIILFSALFIGMVVSLQGFHTLQKFSAEQELGSLLALSVVRELGPVVAGLLFAGRACSTLAAEIGLMKATDQLDAMEMMGINPLWRVIAPRFWAGIIAMPILATFFNLVAIYGGYLVGVHWLGVDAGSFINNMKVAVDFRLDIVNGLLKSVAFGVISTWIAVYQGYYATANAAGISRATTKTVVYASLLVLFVDFVLTSLMMKGW